MAAHQMAAEPIGQSQRLFEVDLAGRPQADGLVEAFERYLHAETLSVERDGGHAGTLDRYRVADHHITQIQPAGIDMKAQSRALPQGLDPLDAADRRDNSGKHQFSSCQKVAARAVRIGPSGADRRRRARHR